MNAYLWIKTFHIVFIVTWFAGLFYLPRLFVYHAEASDKVSIERFKVMERKLFFGITTPGGILSVVTGFVLFAMIGGFAGSWLVYKLILVAILIGYHVVCWHYLKQFKNDRNTRSHVYYRWFNEVPTLLLIAIIALAVFKPL